MNSNTELIIYTTDDGVTKVEATFDGDTVWLSQEQMGELFQRDKSTISRHIRNKIIKNFKFCFSQIILSNTNIFKCRYFTCK